MLLSANIITHLRKKASPIEKSSFFIHNCVIGYKMYEYAQTVEDNVGIDLCDGQKLS